jgi:predicted O-methyltransferase YrrM
VKSTRFLLSYLRYYLTASTKHAIHSPFVFELLTTVIESRDKHPQTAEIEGLRKKLMASEEEIEVQDLGAGSQRMTGSRRHIREIAKHSAKSQKYGQLLFRLSKHFHPSRILELGTSFGISTLYLQAGTDQAEMTTMEGCTAIAAVARQNFLDLRIPNIRLLEGTFENLLPTYLKGIEKTDLIFFDGNHRLQPTLDYFRLCLKNAGNDTLFIFDDIHWTDEMTLAWEEIKNHPSVTITIDLFFLGLVFFRKQQQEKQHFIIRF